MIRTRRSSMLAALVALLTLAPLVPGRSAFAQPDNTLSTVDAPGISFRAPIDFATGADPSSEAFNAASGDQSGFVLTRAPLSDSVVVRDFNHDGRRDVAQTNVIAGTVSVFLGDGVGDFGPPRQHAVGVNPVFVVAGDLGRDGHLDLAVANPGSDDVAILRGDGDGGFQPATFVSVPDPRNVAIGRFNRGKVPDLAVASAAPTAGANPPQGGVAILAGKRDADGNSTFEPTQFITTRANDRPVGPNYVEVADFDRSGFDDLAVGVGTSGSAGDRQADDKRRTGDDVLIFLNRNEVRRASAEQPFNTTPDQPAIRVGGLPSAIASADLNGDTHRDLAVVDSGSGDITTLLGNRRGHFFVKATNVTVGGIPRAVDVGDFNRDGIPDVVTANFSASTVSVLQGNGDGTLQPAVDFWSGDATTGVAVGHFNRDRRLDIVTARLRTDQLSLLLNDSPQPGDGVLIERDIYYGTKRPRNDPLAAHHTLDVYSPPRGTSSFAGPGRPYPVVFFVHGGSGISGDKSQVSYLMRSLALEGIVAVSTNYRLGPGLLDAQTEDVAQAFRWTYDNVGSKVYRGDSSNIFVFGHSHGATPAARLGTQPKWLADQKLDYQKHLRGMLLAGFCGPVAPALDQRPSLLLTGTEGLEVSCDPVSAAFSKSSEALLAEAPHETIPGRDHFTLVSDMALTGDPARAYALLFIHKHLTGSAVVAR